MRGDWGGYVEAMLQNGQYSEEFMVVYVYVCVYMGFCLCGY